MGKSIKFIKLTKGQFAIVDASDFDWLNQWKWFFHEYGGGYAARNSDYIKGKKRYTVLMHRQIMDVVHKPRSVQVDHINRERLDLRRCNLRIVTSRENCTNRTKQHNNTSGFIGVNWLNQKGLWVARISVNNKRIFLTSSKRDIIKCAKAYDVAARKYHGKLAELNFPGDK